VNVAWSFTTEDTTFIVPDVVAPALSGADPADGAVAVARDTKLIFVLTDAQTGVDTGAVTVLVDGNPPAKVSFLGVPTNYAVVCELAGLLPANSTIDVLVAAQDLSSPPNATNVSWSFATEETVTAEEDLSPPVLAGMNPGDGVWNIALDTDVIFVLSDVGAGVDTASVSVFVNGSPPARKSFFGLPSSYMVVCELADSLPGSSLIPVVVSSRDLSSVPNSMNASWSFATRSVVNKIDDEPPLFSNLDPADAATGVDPARKIRVGVRDDTGVDPSTIEFRYNGDIVEVRVTVADTLFRSAVIEFENPGGFEPGTVVDVTVSACDWSSNCATRAYSFTVAEAPVAQSSAGQIVPDGYWVGDVSRPLEVQKLPRGWTVRIFDAAGSQVKRFQNTQEDYFDWTWDFKNDTGGRVVRSLYLVRVIDDRGEVRRSGRFVVQSDY
jgi:hypothetical protein